MAERKRMTTRFKELFEQKQFFVMAGGMNPIGARMAEALGYEVFYMSGGNTSAHQLGWPDSGSSMRDMVDNARKIVLTVGPGNVVAAKTVTLGPIHEGLRVVLSGLPRDARVVIAGVANPFVRPGAVVEPREGTITLAAASASK